MKLSKEDADFIQHSCIDNSTKMISFLTEQLNNQDKDIKIDRIISIIAIIISLIALFK